MSRPRTGIAGEVRRGAGLFRLSGADAGEGARALLVVTGGDRERWLDGMVSNDVAGLEDEWHVHPDGRAKELFHNFLPIMESKCGPLSCTHCHDAHGRGLDLLRDR